MSEQLKILIYSSGKGLPALFVSGWFAKILTAATVVCSKVINAETTHQYSVKLLAVYFSLAFSRLKLLYRSAKHTERLLADQLCYNIDWHFMVRISASRSVAQYMYVLRMFILWFFFNVVALIEFA